MTDFETESPSVRNLQTLIKEAQEVEVKLITDDLLVGKILWQDQHCFCLNDQYDQQTYIWRQALVYLKPKA